MRKKETDWVSVSETFFLPCAVVSLSWAICYFMSWHLGVVSLPTWELGLVCLRLSPNSPDSIRGNYQVLPIKPWNVFQLHHCCHWSRPCIPSLQTTAVLPECHPSNKSCSPQPIFDKAIREIFIKCLTSQIIPNYHPSVILTLNS